MGHIINEDDLEHMRTLVGDVLDDGTDAEGWPWLK
jgi:hypothetical protein